MYANTPICKVADAYFSNVLMHSRFPGPPRMASCKAVLPVLQVGVCDSELFALCVLFRLSIDIGIKLHKSV